MSNEVLLHPQITSNRIADLEARVAELEKLQEKILMCEKLRDRLLKSSSLEWQIIGNMLNVILDDSARQMAKELM